MPVTSSHSLSHFHNGWMDFMIPGAFRWIPIALFHLSHFHSGINTISAQSRGLCFVKKKIGFLSFANEASPIEKTTFFFSSVSNRHKSSHLTNSAECQAAYGAFCISFFSFSWVCSLSIAFLSNFPSWFSLCTIAIFLRNSGFRYSLTIYQRLDFLLFNQSPILLSRSSSFMSSFLLSFSLPESKEKVRSTTISCYTTLVTHCSSKSTAILS